MNSIIKPLLSIYEVNSKLAVNSFKDVTEMLSLKRPNKKTNSMMFILLHTLDARYYLLKSLGSRMRNPYAKYVDWSNSIEDLIKYPRLKNVLSTWRSLDKTFKKKLSSLTAKQLNAKLESGFPGNDKPVINMISFLAEHEAYHVGQLALLKKYFGLPAVTF